MTYTHVQFIAYCIHTAPQINDKGVEKYVGLKGENTKDIDLRVGLVKIAIDTAKGAAKPSTQAEKILKIFITPEFFFRGHDGAYDMTSVHHAVQSLQETVKAEEWKDWLFVFGTILGQSAPALFPATPPALALPEPIIDPTKPKEIYNFVLVQKGGFPDAANAPANAHVIQKRKMSDIDFINKAPLGSKILRLTRVTDLPPNPAIDPTDELQKSEYDGSSIFTRDGITFGIEVCLDHANYRLMKGKGKNKINIQLVTSCGMTINHGAIAVENSGYIFLCDGMTDGASTPTYTAHSTLFSPKGNFIHSTSSIKINSQINSQTVEIDKIFAKGAGELRLYPTEPLS